MGYECVIVVQQHKSCSKSMTNVKYMYSCYLYMQGFFIFFFHVLRDDKVSCMKPFISQWCGARLAAPVILSDLKQQRAVTNTSDTNTNVLMTNSFLTVSIIMQIWGRMKKQCFKRKVGQVHTMIHSIFDISFTHYYLLLGSHRINFKDLAQKQERDQ